MHFAPIIDMGWPVIASYAGLQTLAYAAPLTILGEAMVIRRLLPLLNKTSFWRAAKDSIIMNILSGILGLLVFSALIGSGGFLTGEFSGATYYSATPESIVVLYSGMLVIFCIVSIVVEGFILGLLESKSPRQLIWRVVLLGNLASYLGLFAIVILRYKFP